MAYLMRALGFIWFVFALGCGGCGLGDVPPVAGTSRCVDRPPPTVQFEMPETNELAYSSERGAGYGFPPDPPEQVKRNRIILFVREPAAGNEEATTLWARSDDSVVLDLIWRVDGEDIEGSTYLVDVFAFLDLARTPFFLKRGTYEEGEAKFATLEELSTTTPWRGANELEARHGEVMVFSVMFPSESLGPQGAKDLRLAMALRPLPRSGAVIMKTSSQIYDFTLYYGGMRFGSERPSPVSSDYREPDVARIGMMDLALGGLLEPPAESLDVISSPTGARLGEVLDTPDDPIRVRAWLAGNGQTGQEGGEMGGEVGIVTLVDDEVLAEATGLAMNRPREYYNPRRSERRQEFSQFATVLDFELPEREGTQLVRMLKFTEPFCHQRTPGTESFWSNALFVR